MMMTMRRRIPHLYPAELSACLFRRSKPPSPRRLLQLLSVQRHAVVTMATTPKKRCLSSSSNVEAMSLSRIMRYLELQEFTPQELQQAFRRIRVNVESEEEPTVTTPTITATHVQEFLNQRFDQLEEESPFLTDRQQKELLRETYIQQETQRFLRTFAADTIDREHFCHTLQQKATQVDVKRTWPITASMLLVGSSVGIITPAMPFVVESLSLSASQYGMVVSGFPLAKMIGNIPSAIAVERHGRKPYMTYSLGMIALGVGGIGLAGSFEELYLCRLMTGLGVSFLSTAGTMMITDLSTPLNRASTMAPIMSAFAAGTALGPAMGGYMVDTVGLNQTFYLVGASYFGVALINNMILNETKEHTPKFPWQQNKPKMKPKDENLVSVVQGAVSQWVPLVKDSRVRNVLIMNGLYWVALAGAQMTLLPLILTDSSGLAMSATEVGQVYMGMSLVQIFGNPIFAKVTDRIGKAPAIVGGCGLISASMAGLSLCTNVMELVPTLFMWGVGSSMLSTAPVAYISDRVASDKRAQAIALLRSCGDVGFLIGATSTGTLADWTGSLSIAMQSNAGLLLVATSWFATRQLLNRRIDEAMSNK